MAMSADRSRLFSGSLDKTIRVWNTKTGECLKVLKGHTDGVTGICYRKSTDSLVTASTDNTVRIWDLEVRFVILDTIATL
jgi:F-box/WD-40 domain protein MET30